jgi:hypothetical protein
VPCAWVGRTIEVRGTTAHVVCFGADGTDRTGLTEIARHPRGTLRRVVLADAHYDGASTAAVTAPSPVGRRARQQLAVVPHAAVLPAPSAITRPLAHYTRLLALALGGIQ